MLRQGTLRFDTREKNFVSRGKICGDIPVASDTCIANRFEIWKYPERATEKGVLPSFPSNLSYPL
ncbi:hypothetical protein ASB62_03775 [Chlorobium limicola]|uniref:Uncharacterized protein n=1 Tax=Chlorobium limicola TaxID=1092 RepID=A0A101JQ86_CHLLI|nr:hypothetical protein ASB62_03775 [Chlorobium limicola]